MHQQKVCPEANEKQMLCRLWDGFIVHKAYSSGYFFLLYSMELSWTNSFLFISDAEKPCSIVKRPFHRVSKW